MMQLFFKHERGGTISIHNQTVSLWTDLNMSVTIPAQFFSLACY